MINRIELRFPWFSAWKYKRVLPTIARMLCLALMGSSMAISSNLFNVDKTVEEERVLLIKAAELGIAQQLDRLSETMLQKLIATKTEGQLRQFVQSEGFRLWDSGRKGAVNDFVIDDRPLYWQRLVVAPMIRARAKQLRLSSETIEQLLTSFEQTSRGQNDIVWTVPGARRVLITGFDPFSLDRHIGQSNPSGAIALSLDGRGFEGNGGTIEINAAIFPVRYVDFDVGILEQWLAPHLSSGLIDLFVSVSMGRDQFDLERFPGRRRSSSALGNLQEHTGGTAAFPKPGLLDGEPLQGPEFVEFSLPVALMQRAEGDYKIRDNHTVTTLERGTFEAASLASLRYQTAVQGSGGGYLSNEISYRSIRLANELGVALPMGHIHTPSIEGSAPKEVASIVSQVREMLLLAASPVQ